MQYSDIPGFIVLPFADSGGKTTIPVTTASPGRASLTDGFPALTRTPIASGGIPPDGTDMNGILFEISAWSRWVAAGCPVQHDAAFATAIGGYPKGAVLTMAGGIGQWTSWANNNGTDPDAAGTGWYNSTPIATTVTATMTLSIRQFGLVLVDATAGNITLSLPAAGTISLPQTVTLVRTDSTANTVTISRSGSNTIEGLVSVPLSLGMRLTLISDGVSSWRITSRTAASSMIVFTANGTFTVPPGVYRVKVTVTGGGGGGSGCSSGTGGAGGGAGGTAIDYLSLTPGDTVAVTVGAGGAAGAIGGGTGGNAGTSSFGSYMSATGGNGGAVVAGGGTGGTPLGAALLINGGYGGDGSGGLNATYGGNGGASFWGGGGRGGTSAGGGGIASRTPGGGGGGGYDQIAGTGSTGGAGSAGLVVVEWN